MYFRQSPPPHPHANPWWFLLLPKWWGRIFLPQNILKRRLIFYDVFMGGQGRVGGTKVFFIGRGSRYGHFYFKMRLVDFFFYYFAFSLFFFKFISFINMTILLVFHLLYNKLCIQFVFSIISFLIKYCFCSVSKEINFLKECYLGKLPSEWCSANESYFTVLLIKKAKLQKSIRSYQHQI